MISKYKLKSESYIKMNWIIGQQYELVEKSGHVYELGMLVTINKDGSLKFKKVCRCDCSHVHRIEPDVTYRIKSILHEEALQDILNTEGL